jgi:general L-amino acid transport system substrate-binding protein
MPGRRKSENNSEELHEQVCTLRLGDGAGAGCVGCHGGRRRYAERGQSPRRAECGVNTGLIGFAAPDANGNWSGFDVAFCKAVAAAVLGDATKVKYVPTTGQTRFTALSSGEVDLLARNSTWTFQRDTDLKLDFIGVNYYDGQGFMVRKDLGVSSAKELDGATVCIQTGTTTELNLADYFKSNNMEYQPVNIDSNAEGEQQYMAGACDAYTTDASGLAATRASFADPENHIILPEIISKEPLGPAVRHGDNNWGDIARWTLYALVAAEEYGVTSANIDELAKSSQNPEVQRLLGTTDDLGKMIGLDKPTGPRCHQGQRQLWRDLCRHHRRTDPDRSGARAERAMDPGRADVRHALPLIAA